MERPKPELSTQTRTTGDRILAVIADTFLVFVVSIAISSVLPNLLRFDFPWIFVITMLAYHTYFEGEYGQTLGKKALNIVVVMEDGEPCDYQAAAIRNVIRLIDSFMFYLVGIIFIIVTDDNQRLGDIVGDTVVMEVRRETPDDDGPDDDGPEEDPDFHIKLHEDEADRAVELINKTSESIDLSRGVLRTEAGDEFRFPEGEEIHRPETPITHLIPDDFAIEPGTGITAITRTGEQHTINWPDE